jgi:hypothetical protein
VSLPHRDAPASCRFCSTTSHKHFGVLLSYLIRAVTSEARKDVEPFVINKYPWYCQQTYSAVQVRSRLTSRHEGLVCY